MYILWKISLKGRIKVDVVLGSVSPGFINKYLVIICHALLTNI